MKSKHMEVLRCYYSGLKCLSTFKRKQGVGPLARCPPIPTAPKRHVHHILNLYKTNFYIPPDKYRGDVLK
jgi:hypothetical protein